MANCVTCLDLLAKEEGRCDECGLEGTEATSRVYCFVCNNPIEWESYRVGAAFVCGPCLRLLEEDYDEEEL